MTTEMNNIEATLRANILTMMKTTTISRILSTMLIMTARVATNEMQGILQGALEFTDGLLCDDPWSYCDGNQNRMFKSEMEKGMKPAGKCCRCSVFLFIFFLFR